VTDHLWFKARAFGWGWTPVSFEGWAVLIAFLALVAAGTGVFIYELRAGADVRAANLLFMAGLALLVGLLILICWLTGERPRWRWGG
jgi:hypothetical protein